MKLAERSIHFLNPFPMSYYKGGLLSKTIYGWRLYEYEITNSVYSNQWGSFYSYESLALVYATRYGGI